MSIDRRSLFGAGLGAGLAGAAVARTALAQTAPVGPVGVGGHTLSPGPHAEPFQQVEIVRAASGFFGAAAQTISGVIEKVFKDQGLPTGYIAGTEVAAGVVVGLRYGKGELYMKRHRRPEPVERVFWQGPSAGFNFGANASRCFTLVYAIQDPAEIFHRFPGVDGSIYVVGGFGVNYQRGEGLVLAPIRAGIGGQVNASVGYLDYSRHRHISPF